MEQYNLEDLGNRVKEIRKALKLTQTEFGQALDMSKSFISDIEGGRSKAGYDFFFHIARVFDVNLYYLVYGEGNMFGREGIIPSLGNKRVGEAIESGAELLWYLEHSPMFSNLLLGYATKILYENERIIKKDIKIKLKKGELT